MQVLLIEDNPVDAQAIVEALDRVTTEAGELRVRHLENLAALAGWSSEQPDVVLLDLSLGDSEGLASIRGVRAVLHDAPIVVLTGDKSEQLAFEALREGAQDYLVKGAYSSDTLLRSIRYAIERHSLKMHLIRADRLAAVGQLAAGVAHEVANPANFVLGSSIALDKQLERIAAELAAPLEPELDVGARLARLSAEVAEARRLAEANLAGIERIAKVTRELQNYSRLGQREISVIDVNRVVQQSANLVRSSLLHRAELVLRLQSVPGLAADESKLEQVITNLLMNAIFAVAESGAGKGEISVSTGVIAAGTPQASIRITVEDSGTGIAPENLRLIFEPFYTTKPKARGTGLGLALAREIVRLHGGTIECESEVGKGTRFIILLPLDNALEAPSSKPAQVLSQAPVTRARVLLIDDEPMILRLFQSVVGAEHDVVARESAEQVLELLRTDSKFDIVVCDFTMPGMGGLALYARIKAVAPHLVQRFIFCTGGVIDERERELTQQSSVRILYKPVRPAALLAAINERLGELR